MIIDVDLDATIADFFKSLLNEYNEITGENVVVGDIHSWDMAQHVKDPVLLQEIFHRPGFFKYLDPLDGAIEGVRQLVEFDHDVNIVTSGCTTHSFGEKAEWCAKHLPFIPLSNVNISHRKGRFIGDVLIDDGAHNVQAYRQTNPKAILIGIEHPHNRARWMDWDHLVPDYSDTALAWARIVKIVRAL